MEMSEKIEATAEKHVSNALKHLKLDKAHLIVEALEFDILGRRGLSGEWEEIDEDVRELDIKKTWEEIINQVLAR